MKGDSFPCKNDLEINVSPDLDPPENYKLYRLTGNWNLRYVGKSPLIFQIIISTSSRLGDKRYTSGVHKKPN